MTTRRSLGRGWWYRCFASISSVALAAGFIWIVSGCSTPQTRARQNPELMETLSAEERVLVESGKIDVGFTPEMVRVALGEPDRRYTEQTAEGRAEIWAYHESRRSPRFSVGVGSVFGGGTSYGGGVSVGTGGRLRVDERIRVVFREGRVAAYEAAED